MVSPTTTSRDVFDRFRSVAESQAETEAVVFQAPAHSRSPSDCLTYTQLLNRSLSLASTLRSSYSLKEDEWVGVFMPPSIHLLPSILGVMACGAVYVPLDPTMPQGRLHQIIRSAGIRLILTFEHLLIDAVSAVEDPSLGVNICLVDALQSTKPSSTSSTAHSASSTSLVRHTGSARPTGLAYVIYTSGSTGSPKGVMLGATGLLELCAHLPSILHLQRGRRVLQFASLAFDASIWEIFPTLLSGATLILAPRAAVLPGPELLATLEASGANVLTINPSSLSILSPFAHSAQLMALDTVVVAGEACGLALAKSWTAPVPGPHGVLRRRFFNAYGPTETTVCSTIHQFDEAVDVESVSIGNCRLMPYLSVLLLDDEMREVNDGGVGEIYVSGSALALGYVDDAALTAQYFVHLPHHGGQLAYRTRDRARWVDSQSGAAVDRELVFTGRSDQQVKIRGSRVEMGEVESVLQRHDGVDSVIVFYDPQAVAIVAIVVPSHRHHLVPANVIGFINDLKLYLRSHLSDYAVPAFFLIAEGLPLADNGSKINRERAIRIYTQGRLRGDSAATMARNVAAQSHRASIESSWGEDEVEAVAAASSTIRCDGDFESVNGRVGYPSKGAITSSTRDEKVIQGQPLRSSLLCQLFADALSLPVEDVNPDSSFFELGGSSLLAATMIASLKREWHVEVSIALLYRRPSPRQLLAYIERVQSTKGEKTTPSTRPDGELVERVALRAEARLSEDIRPVCPSFDLASDLRDGLRLGRSAVLLTGATGFLGVYTLMELLTVAEKGYTVVESVIAIVRGSEVASARQRLMDNFAKYDLHPTSAALRHLEVIAGDLSLRHFGLSSDAYQALSDRIGCIIHAAADVSYVKPYATEADRASSADSQDAGKVGSVNNVDSTSRILSLACSAHPAGVPLHYISTLAVFGAARTFFGWDVITEDMDPADCESLMQWETGYTKSKWIAEMQVKEANHRGLPVCIYRTGFIEGATSTGQSNRGDFFCRLIKACTQMRCYPDMPHKQWQPIPVDFVGQSIVHIALTANDRGQWNGKAFHVVPKHEMGTSDMFAAVRSMGYPMQKVSFTVWLDEVVRLVEQGDESNALFPLASFITQPFYHTNTLLQMHCWSPRADQSQLREALSGSSRLSHIPSFDHNALASLLLHYIRYGFLQPPVAHTEKYSAERIGTAV